MLLEPLIIYAFLLGFATFLFFTGFVINSFIENKAIREIPFFNMLSGTTFWVVFYALVKASFLSVNIGILLVAFFWVFADRGSIGFKYFSMEKAGSWFLSTAALFLLPLSLLFLFNFFDFYNFAHGYYIKDGDLVFYSKVSAFLKYYGLESKHLNIFFKEGPNPYHYFELWLNAFFSSFSTVVSLKSLKLITIPLLQGIIYLGFVSFFKHYRIKGIRLYTGAFMALFFTGIFPFFLKDIALFESAKTFLLSILNPKFLTISIFLQAFFILLLMRCKKAAFFMLACLPIVSIAVAPGVLMATLAYFAIRIFIKKEKDYFILLLTFLSVATFLFCFYFFLSGSGFEVNKVGGSLFNFVKQAGYIKTARNIVVGGSIYMAILYLIPLLIFFLFGKELLKIAKQNLSLVLWGVLFLGASLVSWALGHFLVDAVQFFSVSVVAFLNLVFVLSFLHLFSNKQGVEKWIVALSFSFITICVVCSFISTLSGLKNTSLYRFDKPFLNAMRLESVKGLGKGAFISNCRQMKNIFDKQLDIYYPTDFYLPLYTDKIFLTSLSFPYIPLSENLYLRYNEVTIRNGSPFYVFLQLHKDKGNRQKDVSDFIKDMGIGFIVVERGADANSFLGNIPFKKILEDPVSGQKVFFIEKFFIDH